MSYRCRASKCAQYCQCPGSAKAEDDLPEVPGGPDADKGIRIHAMLAAKAATGVWPDKVGTEELEIAQVLWDKVLALGIDNGPEPAFFLVEQKVDVEDGFTGTADLIAQSNGLAMVCDYKSGHGDQIDADANPQLRIYTVNACILGIIKPPVKSVIITPFFTTSVVYTERDVADAAQEVYEIYESCQKEDAPRIVGPLCVRCKAFSTSRCPETSMSNQIAVVEAVKDISTFTGQELSDLFAKVALVEKACKMIKDEAKRRLEADPEAVPGFQLVPGAKVRTITDVGRASGLLGISGLSVEEIGDCYTLPIGAVEKVAARHFGSSAKEASKWVGEVLASVIEVKQNSPSVKAK